MLQIITDTASDITLAQASQMGIHIVPINIQFPDGPCPQETETDFQHFYERLIQADELPKTSQPTPDQYLQHFQAAKDSGDEVLVLTLSSGLSGTVNVANIAKDLCEYDAVHIVDSRQAIASQRILVEYAVKLREENVPTQEIIQKLESLRDRITVSGVLDTLTYLKKGGRVPPSLALIGNTLRIKPVIVLEDKVLKAVGKAFGREAGKRLIYQRFEKFPPDPEYPIYFVYSSDKALGVQFQNEMIQKYNLSNYRTELYPVSGIIGSHVGTNGFGLAYVIKQSAFS